MEVSIIFDPPAAACIGSFALAADQGIQQAEKMRNYFTLVIIFLFLLLSGIFYAMKVYVPEYRYSVLMTGNVVMALLSVITYFMVKKTMNAKPEAFVRGVYGATFLKLMVCMASILLYAMLNKKDIHKPSLFVLFGIYAVYTAVETWLLGRLAKDAK